MQRYATDLLEEGGGHFRAKELVAQLVQLGERCDHRVVALLLLDRDQDVLLRQFHPSRHHRLEEGVVARWAEARDLQPWASIVRIGSQRSFTACYRSHDRVAATG